MGRHGKFLVVEGIDGSGKSSLVRSLFVALQNLLSGEAQVVTLREPTDGAIGKIIRSHLLAHSELSSQEWLDLFLADRKENVEQNIEPAIVQGHWVLQDRYYFSTAAYQGGLPTGYSSISILEKNREAGFPSPDMIFFLDVDPQTAMQRIRKRNSAIESFETECELVRIYDNYLQILPESAVRIPASLNEKDAVAFALYAIQKNYPSVGITV